MAEATRTVAEFTVGWTGYLAPDGTPRDPDALPEIAFDRAALTGLYRAMVLTRLFDGKAVALQRTGKLGTYASAFGEEAVGAGVASAMRAEDVLAPAFRDQAAQMGRGVTPFELLRYWGGDERGSDFSVPRADFPTAVPVATQYPHAAGAAAAFALRREARVAVAMGGDGSTSKGDFYEAMNIAGAWNLPVVFVIANNQWAISVPRAAQTAAPTLAQKAIAAGIPGEQVDGNDVLAVREVMRRVVETARAGGGPALVEALTYRLTDHTTADDARRYRPDAEVSDRLKHEPIARLRAFLVARQGWTKADEEAVFAECRALVAEAVAAYEADTPPPLKGIFDHQFAALPAALEPQRAAVLARAEEARHA